MALLLAEPGADRVKADLDGALLSAVNLGEIVSYYAKLGVDRAQINSLLRPLPIEVIPADEDLSYLAGMLRPATLKAGLSLGDRYCLALAKREEAPALTAERRWPALAQTVGVEIKLIR